MSAIVALFKERAGFAYHGGAIAYAVLAYVSGFAGLFDDSWLVNGIGLLLLARDLHLFLAGREHLLGNLHLAWMYRPFADHAQRIGTLALGAEGISITKAS